MLRRLLIGIPLYIAWVIVALYLVFGLCKACLVPGPLEWLGLIVYTASVMIPFWLLRRWWSADPGWIKAVEAHGKRATATILSVNSTGVVLNNTVGVVKVRLRVEPPDEAPFEINHVKPVSMVNGQLGYSAGAHVKVKYDPNNRNHIILGDSYAPSRDHATPGSTVSEAHHARPDVTEKLAELSRLHKSGELSDSEFAEAKKKLLG